MRPGTVTFDLAQDFSVVDAGDVLTIYDYALKRVIVLNDKAHTYSNNSLYGLVDSLGGAGVDASFEPSKQAIGKDESARLAKLLRAVTPLAPTAIDRIVASGYLPQTLSFGSGKAAMTWTLQMSAAVGDAYPLASSARPPNPDPSDGQKALGEAYTAALAEIAGKTSSLLRTREDVRAAIESKLAGKHPFQALLLALDMPEEFGRRRGRLRRYPALSFAEGDPGRSRARSAHGKAVLGIASGERAVEDGSRYAGGNQPRRSRLPVDAGALHGPRRSRGRQPHRRATGISSSASAPIPTCRRPTGRWAISTARPHSPSRPGSATTSAARSKATPLHRRSRPSPTRKRRWRRRVRRCFSFSLPPRTLKSRHRPARRVRATQFSTSSGVIISGYQSAARSFQSGLSVRIKLTFHVRGHFLIRFRDEWHRTRWHAPRSTPETSRHTFS